MANPETTRGIGFWRAAPWALAVALLVIPFVAMQFTSQMDWDETDFIVMGVMLACACGGWELAVRARSWAQRAGAAVAIVAAFLTVWVNLAVGMIGSADNPHNLLFGAVLLLALLGAAVARFRPAGLAWVMAATALAQALVGAAGLGSDVRGALFSMAFAAPWLLAAWLFGRAGRAAGTA